jgi:hypothetical protein
MSLISYIWRTIDRLFPARKLIIIAGDSLPTHLPFRNVILARDGNEDWCVGMSCPCGCGHKIELLVIKEAKPRWDITIDKNGCPSLLPSVWLQNGCRSHFWLKNGRIIWCP